MAVPTLTIAVLTQNEAHRIEACLASAAFADQVLVVDSGSTDNTVALSRQAGAEVFEYPDWQGFAVQRNRLIAHAKCDYIFFLDADELITPAFQKELQAIVQSNAHAVWQIQWRMVAYGHELKHYISRSKVERLFRRDMLKAYVGAVHEQAILHNENPASPVPRKVISAKLLHHSRETVRGSLEKLTQYVMLGASKRAQAGKRGGVVRGLASGLSMFVRLYVFRLGFCAAALAFCIVCSWPWKRFSVMQPCTTTRNTSPTMWAVLDSKHLERPEWLYQVAPRQAIKAWADAPQN